MMRLLFEEMETENILEYKAKSFTLNNLIYNVVLSDNTILHLRGCRFISCTPEEKEIEVISI